MGSEMCIRDRNVCVRVIKSISLLELRSFLDTGSFLFWINNYILMRENANVCKIFDFGSEPIFAGIFLTLPYPYTREKSTYFD